VHTFGATVTLTFPSQAASGDLHVTLPNGVEVDPAITVAQVDGQLVANYDPPVPGRYTYRCVDDEGRGWEDVFNVRPGRSMALCSLADARKHLNMEADDEADDDELRGHIEAATGAIERHRNEVVAARTLTAVVTGGQILPRHPVVRVTSAASFPGGSPVDVADWTPDPDTGLVTVPKTTRGVRVEYFAGYEIVPEDFVLAAAIIAAHLWETQRMSSIGGPATAGEDQYLTPSGLGYAIPNRAVQLLGGRPPVFA
jgi:hypothetical protein